MLNELACIAILSDSYKFACTFHHDTDRGPGASLPRMENTLCDISALLFWRTPPIVRLLALGPADEDPLCHLVDPVRLERMRHDLVDGTRLAGLTSGPASWHTHLGVEAGSLLAAAPLLAAFTDAPVDLLVTESAERRHSSLVRPRVWTGALPDETLFQPTPGLTVVPPALALQQVAARSSLGRTIALASELCGVFSAYQPPQPLANLLQDLFDEGRLIPYGGWSAAADNNGRLTGLWSRPPLATPAGLVRDAERSGTSRGRARLEQAAGLVQPGAASPFEVQAGMLLGLSRRRGGEGLGDFQHNRRIVLTPDAARVAERHACSCDLFFRGTADRKLVGVDVECQSSAHHFGVRSSASDANRATALQLMGIEVVQLTYAQLADPTRFKIFSALLAEKLGLPYREKTDAQLAAQTRLRAEILTDWGQLPLA